MKRIITALAVVSGVVFITAIDSIPLNILAIITVIVFAGYILWRALEWNSSCTPTRPGGRTTLTTIERHSKYTLPDERTKRRLP
jgi:hypothetical protein